MNENTPQTPTQSPKIGSINSLRFFAALGVMFFHLTFATYSTGISYVDIPVLRHIFQYGYLGVDLFFIISGFVISISVENRNAYSFLKSRVGRLYPVFWISVITTSLFLLFGGYLINSEISWYRFWANMTMVPTILPKDGLSFLDGSYWTLTIEMIFYFFIFLLLLLKKFKKIEIIAIPASIIMMLLSFFLEISPESNIIWIPNFIAGVIFYKIYKNGLNNWRIFALLNTLLASLIFATNRIPNLYSSFKTDFNQNYIILYILFFYILFLFISLNKFKVTNNKYVNTLGLLTFPVYLIHQEISRIIFLYAYIKKIPLYISFPFVVIFIFVVSFLIHKIFENRGRIILNKIIDKITPRYLKQI